MLGHILYRPFYFETLSITGRMYETWAYGREQALEILDHVNSRYAFHMEGREVSFGSIARAFLSQQIRYLAKKVKVEEGISKANTPDILTSEKVIRAIAVSFSGSDWLLDSLATHRRFRRPADQYHWYDNSDYTVTARERGGSASSGLDSPSS